MGRIMLGVAVLSVVPLMALAQEMPLSTIATDGVAVVDTMPTYAEFWIQVRAKGATTAEAVEAALRFEPTLRKELQGRQLTPAELTFTGIAFPDAAAAEAHVSAKLRFSVAALTTAEEGPRQFAALCDQLSAINAIVGGVPLQGPFLGADNKQDIEDAAVARATEKAYPAAKATARVMNGQIIAVSAVTVESTTWNDAPGVNATQPDLRRLTCTAKVRIVYTFSPS